ncbi:MAG: WecB/TagA/CpsF family glycosyltransferase [Chloroflexi bacterium]|nr:WecB/TagA/CpsF family glycosyltransferase [Chloroflexota bacterium]
MIDKGKKNILGVQVNAIDYDAAVTKIVTSAHDQKAMTVSALAVHGVMTGVLDRTHCYRLNHLDLIVPDGQPVCWALNWLYHTQLPDRVYGPTLMLKICERASQEGLPIYLYGSRLPIIQALSRNLCSRFPNLVIAGAQPSRFRQISMDEKREIAQDICDSGAAITFVGLGCPRQEVWVHEYREVLPMPLIAVGAAFDFHAGTLSQSPKLLQRFGLEWLFRFANEPNRLWRRYLLLNPLYAGLLVLQIARLKRFDTSRTVAPAQEMRYG